MGVYGFGMKDYNALYIYTDGSCLPKPRRGGIGFKFVFPDSMKKEDLYFEREGWEGAAIGQMELKACTEALKELSKLDELPQVSRVIILTDSRYVSDNYNAAVYRWPKTKWMRDSGAPVLNADYWKELIRVMQKIHKRVEIQWVKGHSKDPHNKAVDKLAKQSAKKATQKLPQYVDVRRKLSEKKTDPGSIKMQGQRISIRIITSERLKTQKVWRLRYEVISKCSVFYKNVDFIFCQEDIWNNYPLRTSHSYSVRFNDNNNYPQIAKIFHEIVKEKKT